MKGSETELATYDVLIVGGGFGGLAVAYYLGCQAVRFPSPLRCVLVEPRALVGAGIAYGTTVECHILNVAAAHMSLDEQDASSFLRWLEGQGRQVAPSEFVARRLYQQYLSAQLSAAWADPGNSSTLQVLHERVDTVVAENVGYRVQLQTGRSVVARQVVLALGNSLVTETPHAPNACLSDPCDSQALEQAAREPEVAIVGSGLSAVDVLVDLEHRGFSGRYTILSRHGHLPRAHSETAVDVPSAVPACEHMLKASSLRELLREFRRALEQGVSWYALFEALRPHTQTIWAALDLKDQRRFLRHLRPLWVVYRHRIPRTSAALLAELVSSGRLTHIRATLQTAERDQRGISFLLKDRGTSPLGPFPVAFNCMGLWSDIRRCHNPILDSLTTQGALSFDALGLGLRCAQNGQVLSAQGKPQQGLYTLGALRRGELWESTAVRELRVQAREIAASLVRAARF